MRPQNASEAAQKQIDSLTGLRIVAALGVFATHFWSRTSLGPWGALEALKTPVTRVMTRGFIGVPLFFMLSGFVLTYSTARAPPTSAPLRKAFWGNRFARIYPAYVLSLLLALPLLYGSVEHYLTKFGRTKGALLASIASCMVATLTQSWFPRAANFWNGPAWSLSVEAFFYALFPYLISSRIARATSCWSPVATVAGLSLVGVAAPLLAEALHGGPLGEADGGVVIYFPILNLPTFLIGMVLARAYLSRPPPAAPAAAGGGALVMGSGAALLAISAVLPSAPAELMDYGLQPLFAALIYGLASGGGWVGRMLSHPSLVFLGEASYSFYLLHIIVTVLVSRVVGASATIITDGAMTLEPWQTAACLATCLVASGVALVTVEKPARVFLRRWLQTFQGHAR